MKDVIFKKVSMQNFLSFGKRQEVEFKDGITAVLSTNRDKALDGNGCGKSTVCSAIAFALYGTVIKDMKKDEIVNRLAKKNCEVELEFDIIDCGVKSEYIIIRGISPSFCKVFKNGEDVTLSGIPATNEYIATLISTTEKMFLNTVMMNSEQPPFMRQRKNEKRDFIEGVFSLQFIKEMNKIVRNEADEISLSYSKINGQIDAKKSLIDSFKSNQKLEKERILNDIELNKKRKDELIVNLTKIENEIKSEGDCLSDDEIKQLESQLNDLNNKSKISEKKREDFKTDYMSKTSKLKYIIDTYNNHEKYMIDSNKIQSDLVVKCKSEFNIEIEDVKNYDFKNNENIIDEYRKQIQIFRSNYDSNLFENKHLEETNKKLETLGNVCDKCDRPFNVDDLEEKNNKIQKNKDIIVKNKNDMSELLSNIDNLNKKIDDEKKRIEKLRNLSNDVRMYYMREVYDLENEKKEIESLQLEIDTKLKPQISVLHKEKEQIEKDIVELMNKINAEKTKHNSITLRKNNLKTIKDQIDFIDTTINNLINCPDLYQQKINEIKDELIKMEEELKIVSNKIEVYRLVREVLSDDGFRAYMIKQYVTALNQYINKYLVILDAPMEISFDEYFDDTIKDNMTGEECSYASLSGGEKRRLDLATLLALVDMREMQGVVKFNHLFFDEVFDSALSVGACSKLMKILIDRKNDMGENSMIITHKTEMQNDEHIDNVLMVEKLGGISSVKYIK